MNITDIRIRRTYDDTRLRALVSITVDHDLAVHDIKIIQGPERMFVAMPSRKDDSGVFRDICHPITPEAREQVETAILTAYREHLEWMEKARAREEAEAGEKQQPKDGQDAPYWKNLDDMINRAFGRDKQ